MTQFENSYTYRAGKKILLQKHPDQFVVRALPDKLKEQGISDAEQVSSSSSRVTVRAPDLEAMMGQARFIAPTHHAYTLAETGAEFLITDRIFVTFHEALPADQVDAFAARYSLIKKETYSDRDYLFQLTDHTGMNPVKLVVKLMEDEPQVAIADHDLNRRATTYQLALPSDPSYPRQWHLHTRLNHSAFDPRASSRCEGAWQLLDSFGNADVVVGVTDDGCKLDHPDFNSPGKFAGWGYFRGERIITHTDIDAQPSAMYQQGSNHGTSCSGVIAAEVDAVLTVGAAPGCRLFPIQWQSSGPSLYISDSKMLTVLNYLADKIDILSNSWGGVPDNRWALNVVNRIKTLAQSGGRRGRGIVFLWAAGNENCPIQHTSNVDIPYTQGWARRPDNSLVWIGVETSRQFDNNLVGIPGVMHVAALASNAQRSHYSNYGTGIGICAPSSNGHEYRRLTVTGLGITTTTGSAESETPNFGGTSSATPLVAGIAALTISANPNLTALEVISILKQTAGKDLNQTPYPRTPPAPYDPTPTWDVSPVAPFDRGDFSTNMGADGSWSPWFGHGCVNAPAAVAEALRRRTSQGGQVIRKISTPALVIPDNNSTGIRDIINIAEVASLTSIKISIELTHTFIGDLRLSLIAPSGTTVVLHNRSGGNADNIQRSYDTNSTPALAALNGQSIQGNWTLFAQDLAAIDIGKLNRWELEIGKNAGRFIEVQDSSGIHIPDNHSEGIELPLAVTQSGQIGEIDVLLDITHPYIGDLRISLISPEGIRVLLHDRTGGLQDNLMLTYSMATTPALAELRSKPMQGTWKLHVADLEAADVGKVNRWALKIQS